MALKPGTTSVQIVGFEDLQRKLQRLGAGAIHMLGRALYEEAEGMMGDSKQHYVPVDTGVLRSTGHVLLPDIRHNQVTVDMGFGGPAAPYAITQHEENYHHTVGERKYLETPVYRRVPSAPRRMAANILADLKKYAAR